MQLNTNTRRICGAILIIGLSIYIIYLVYNGRDGYPLSNHLMGFVKTSGRSSLFGNASSGRSSSEISRRKILMKLQQSNNKYDYRTNPSNDRFDPFMTTHLNITNNLVEYKQRLAKIEEACMQRGTPQITTFDAEEISPKLLVEKKHSILYCNIAKVGSTFWKRMLTVLQDNDRYKSPYDLNLGGAHLMAFQTLKDQLDESRLETFFQKVYSFMFVRDPYARLYSGYENKIYHSNIHFWKSIGSKVVKSVRKNVTGYSLTLGYDVTFSEFVKYILKLWEAGRRINEHFSPMHQHCDPCRIPYHFIGKLETIKDDAQYLVSVWKSMYPDFTVKFNDYEKERTMYTASRRTRFTFQAWRSMKFKVDYPFYNLLIRTWCDLQIRGLLSKHIPFPFTEKEVKHVTAEDFIIAIRRAIDIPTSKTELKMQREEALIQAYRTVPLEDMEKLRQYVLKDCRLFGYDDRPEKLFNRDLPYTNTHLYMKGI